jgi:GT2 family glycosyltransferase
MLRPDALPTRSLNAVPKSVQAGENATTGDWPRGTPLGSQTGRGKSLDTLMVEQVVWAAGQLRITGWCTGSLQLRVLHDGHSLPLSVVRQLRADVAEALSLPEAAPPAGFVLTAEVPSPGPWLLQWQPDAPPGGTPPPPVTGWLHADAIPNPNATRSTTEDAGPAESFPPRISPLSPAAGVIEHAVYHPTARALLVTGWATTAHWAALRIGTDQGDSTSLAQGFSLFRQDVFDALRREGAQGDGALGFVLCLMASSSLRPQQVSLQWQGRALTSALHDVEDAGAPTVITRVPVTEGSHDPLALLQALRQSTTPQALLCERLRHADGAVIDALVRADHARWSQWPVVVQTQGQTPTNPRLSLIVVASGPMHRLEHQIALFAHDEALCEQAQLILVLDDVALAQGFHTAAEDLHRLHPGLSFTWVWGTHPRGMAGAYNLGFSLADAAHCIFMTSQVMPTQVGWAEALLDTLKRAPEVAVVVPQRIGWDRSLRHPVQRMSWQATWQTWLPVAWCGGLDASLDPLHGTQTIRIASATCIAVRSGDLLAVQGWDTGYLTDDFTGPDLCAKLRDTGREVRYQPAVQLTELDSPPPHASELLQVKRLYDATRFQLRWPIEEAPQSHSRKPASVAQPAGAQPLPETEPPCP